MKFHFVLVSTITAIGLSACSIEPPKCSDSETLAVVRQIFAEKFASLDENHLAKNLSAKELESKMLFTNIRASEYHEKIRKISCIGTLTIASKVDHVNQSMNIEYESQLDDNNKQIVSVNLQVGSDLFGVSSALSSNIFIGDEADISSDEYSRRIEAKWAAAHPAEVAAKVAEAEARAKSRSAREEFSKALTAEAWASRAAESARAADAEAARDAREAGPSVKDEAIAKASAAHDAYLNALAALEAAKATTKAAKDATQ